MQAFLDFLDTMINYMQNITKVHTTCLHKNGLNPWGAKKICNRRHSKIDFAIFQRK